MIGVGIGNGDGVFVMVLKEKKRFYDASFHGSPQSVLNCLLAKRILEDKKEKRKGLHSHFSFTLSQKVSLGNNNKEEKREIRQNQKP